MEIQTKQLDIRGQVCPSTLLTTLREMTHLHEEIKRGTLELVILTDNRNATVTVPQAADNMGLHAEVDRVAGSYRIQVRARGELHEQ